MSAILVTHTHWDHFADVPHIAATWKSTVYTTLTGYQLGIAMGLPSTQLAVVKGGEELNMGDAVVRVVRSLHSRNGAGGLTLPGVRMDVPPPPATIADLLEGDTIGFVIRPGVGQPGVLLLGGSDSNDHELQTGRSTPWRCRQQRFHGGLRRPTAARSRQARDDHPRALGRLRVPAPHSAEDG